MPGNNTARQPGHGGSVLLLGYIILELDVLHDVRVDAGGHQVERAIEALDPEAADGGRGAREMHGSNSGPWWYGIWSCRSSLPDGAGAGAGQERELEEAANPQRPVLDPST